MLAIVIGFHRTPKPRVQKPLTMAESGTSVARKKRIKLISLEGAGDNFLGGCFTKMLALTQGQHFFIDFY